MLIESKIRRTGGTSISMGDEVYHFTPGDDGRHVCDVTNKAHIQRFLSITEGFCLVGAEDDERRTASQRPAGAGADKDPLSGDATVDEFGDEDDEGDEDGEDGEPQGKDIDDLDLDELAARYQAAGAKFDRRRSLRVLRSELRRIEAGP